MKIERPFFVFGGKGFFCLEKLRDVLLAGGSPAAQAETKKGMRNRCIGLDQREGEGKIADRTGL